MPLFRFSARIETRGQNLNSIFTLQTRGVVVDTNIFVGYNSNVIPECCILLETPKSTMKMKCA